MSDDADIAMQGEEEIDEELEDVIGRLPKALQDGLQAVGFLMISEAKLKTPVDQGFLWNSTYVSEAVQRGSEAIIEMGYGARYAPSVHEAPGTLKGENVRRKGEHSRGVYWDGPRSGEGEPKFLQKAIDENLRDGRKLFRQKFIESIESFSPVTDRPNDIPDEPETEGNSS